MKLLQILRLKPITILLATLVITACGGLMDSNESLAGVMRIMKADEEFTMPDYRSVRAFDQRWQARGWTMKALKPMFRREGKLPDSFSRISLGAPPSSMSTEEGAVPVAAEIYRDLLASVGPSIEAQGYLPVEERLALSVDFFDRVEGRPLAFPFISRISFYPSGVTFWGRSPNAYPITPQKELTLEEFFALEAKCLNCRQQAKRIGGQSEDETRI